MFDDVDGEEDDIDDVSITLFSFDLLTKVMKLFLCDSLLNRGFGFCSFS